MLYKYRVAYKYTVNGTEYLSDRISQNDLIDGYGWESKKFGMNIVSQYPLGAMIDIYYNPEEPDLSFVKYTETWAPYFYLLVGSIIMYWAFHS
jgi:hypothetical protein